MNQDRKKVFNTKHLGLDFAIEDLQEQDEFEFYFKLFGSDALREEVADIEQQPANNSDDNIVAEVTDVVP